MTTLPIDPKPRYTRTPPDTRTPPGLPAPAWRSGSDSPSRSSMARRNSPRPEETLHEETLHNGVVPAQRKPLSLELPRRLMLDTIPAVPSLSWNAVLAYWLPRCCACATVVTVVQQAQTGTALAKRHRKCLQNQFLVQTRLHGPCCAGATEPTIRRENRSKITARYSQPSPVQT